LQRLQFRSLYCTVLTTALLAAGSLALADPQKSANADAFEWHPFLAVARPQPPAVDGDWGRNPIDAFVAAEHSRLGLQPRPPAPKHVLLRRIYLDLIGLPPTREQLHAFLNDPSPDAYERVVEQLLASPRYGERWGRHWMDIWRYSDWAGWGQQVRDSQPHIWRWRDWIIESLNDDKPYDQMVVDMLAADELMPGDPKTLRATGFLVRNYKRLSREQWLTETVDHTARAFLGTTLKCAQCHDHMYDAMSQEEHYRFRAIFEPHQVRIDPVPGQLDPEKDGLARVYDAELEAPTYFYIDGDERKADKERRMSPGTPKFLGGGDIKAEPVSLPVEAFYPSLQPFVIEEMLMRARSAVEAAKAALAKAQQPGDEKPPIGLATAEKNLAAAEAELQSLEARIAAERAKYLEPSKPEADLKVLSQAASKAERQAALAKSESALVAAEEQLKASGQAAQQDDKAKKVKQEAEKKLEEARKARDAALAATQKESDSYSSLGPIYPRTSSGRRLALARWIASEKNPLTARVAANHIWARHFGRPLVPSADDLGENRKQPTHPALLDWLAAELMQPSTPIDAPNVSSKPWSMKHLHRLIVTANTYRTSSTSDPACAAIDPDNRYLWRTTPRRLEAELIRDSVLYVAGRLDPTTGGPEIDEKQGLTSTRRSLYFRHAPEKQMLFLELFDMAAPTECYERRESVVPQQALALANSELTVLQARHLARQLIAETSVDPVRYITVAFEQILSRGPTSEELETCAAFLNNQVRHFQANASSLGATTTDQADLNKPSSDPATRARENLVHVLMNHHDFVAIR